MNRYIKVPMTYNINGKYYENLYIETMQDEKCAIMYVLDNDENVIGECNTGHDLCKLLSELEEGLYI